MRNHRMRAAAGNSGPVYEVRLGGTSDQYFYDVNSYEVSKTIGGMPSGVSYPASVAAGFHILYFKVTPFSGSQNYFVEFRRNSDNTQLGIDTFTYTGGQFSKLVAFTSLDAGSTDVVKLQIRKGGQFDPIVFTGYFNRGPHYYASTTCNNLFVYKSGILDTYFFGQLLNETCCFIDYFPTICDDPTCPPELPDLVQYVECCVPFTNGSQGSEQCGSILDSYCDDFTFWCG